MPAEEGQPDDQPRVTGQVPPPAPTTGLEQILPGRPPLPHAEEKGAFFVYQRELAPGTRLEQYEIIRVLGSGGFGITYLAKDLFLNRNVVIKENFPSRYSYRDPLTGHIRPNNEHDLENYTWALKSFLSEAQTLAELNNPGIVRILSVFEANGTAYFAMEHITGLSLDYLGEKLHSTGHRYTEDELKGLLTRLLRILDYLHSRHIYHRDIKPGNILLTEEGTPVLIDFGAARHALKLHAATVLTTQGYSSPEQALGKTNIGPWSDLFTPCLQEILRTARKRAWRKMKCSRCTATPCSPAITHGSSCFPWTRRWPPRSIAVTRLPANGFTTFAPFPGKNPPPLFKSSRQTSAMPIRKECQLPAPGKTSAAERPPPERTVFIPPHAGSPHALFAATAT